MIGEWLVYLAILFFAFCVLGITLASIKDEPKDGNPPR